MDTAYPIERIPLDVLRIIFISFADSFSYDDLHDIPRFYSSPSPTYLPPNLPSLNHTLEAPLVLGQVCSTWRYLSRVMPQIWDRTEIVLTKATSRRLRNAVNLLPDCAVLSVSYYFHDIEVVNYALIPSLPRIDVLRIVLVLDATRKFQEIMAHLPPRSLSRLRELWCHNLPCIFGSLNTNLFGPVPRLKGVTMVGLQSSLPGHNNFPWSQLTSLALERSGLDTTQCFAPSPLNQLTCLTLHLNSEAGPTALSKDFSWHQLTSMTILVHTQDHLNLLVSTLQKCVSLVYLKIQATVRDAELIHYQIDLPQWVKSLSVEQFLPISFTDLHQLRNSLTSLILTPSFGVNSQILRVVLYHCRQLVLLKVQMDRYNVIRRSHPIGSVTIPINGDIVLPHLQTLLVSGIRDSHIIQDLFTPSLVKFEISLSDLWGRLGLQPISDFLKRSLCHLRSFYFYPGAISLSSTELKSLLETLDSVRDIIIDEVVLDRNLRSDIASGALLPHLLRLCVRMSQSQFLDLVERRMLMERRRSFLLMREMHCVAAENPDGPAVSQLRRLGKEYGIICSFVV